MDEKTKQIVFAINTKHGGSREDERSPSKLVTSADLNIFYSNAVVTDKVFSLSVTNPSFNMFVEMSQS